MLRRDARVDTNAGAERLPFGALAHAPDALLRGRASRIASDRGRSTMAQRTHVAGRADAAASAAVGRIDRRIGAATGAREQVALTYADARATGARAAAPTASTAVLRVDARIDTHAAAEHLAAIGAAGLDRRRGDDGARTRCEDAALSRCGRKLSAASSQYPDGPERHPNRTQPPPVVQILRNSHR